MYALKNLAPFFLFSLALAADHIPVTIENFDPDFDFKCGSTTISGRDTYNAVAWGTSLDESGETKTGDNGAQYPHYYGNSEGFTFHSSQCNGNDPDRREFPIVKGGYFGDPTTAQGNFRAVYHYDYSTDSEGHPLVYYCGTIYHARGDGSFNGCDV